MTDLRDEIPQRAFINAQILQHFNNDASFRAVVDKVVKNYGIEQYEFMNQAYLVSLLYCLLVVPKELFVEGNESVIDERLQIKSHFDIIKDSDAVASSSSRFLRRLRNSIAHVRYSVDANMTFVFRDRKPGAKDDEFIVIANATALMKCLSDVGAFLANCRNGIGVSPGSHAS